jgi:predicted nucleic acid-binding protein
VNVTYALSAVRRAFLDTAPVVYFVERNPQYVPIVDLVFDSIDAGLFDAITSPITLAECLIVPIRTGNAGLQKDFSDLIVEGNGVTFWFIDDAISHLAAELRARYNLTLPDAFQIAVAIASGCDAFLTNDQTLKRVTEISILVLDELEPPASS